jgi:hypothetical protein
MHTRACSSFPLAVSAAIKHLPQGTPDRLHILATTHSNHRHEYLDGEAQA